MRSQRTRRPLAVTVPLLTPLLIMGCSGARTDGAATELKNGKLEADVITIGPAGKDMHYFRCSAEGGACMIGGTRYMAYGAQGQYLFKHVGGWVNCNNTTFGGDPAPNVAKSCYFSNYGTDGVTGVIPQFQTATVDADVAYGANGAFYFKAFRNQSFTCNDATFGGSPISGTKACYLAVPMFTRVATGDVGASFNAVNDDTIAYGGGGRFIFARKTGSGPLSSFDCNLFSFGGEDPAPGVLKDCYRIVNGHRPTVPIGARANEGETWVEPTGATISNVFYDSGRNGNVLQANLVNGFGDCNNATFGGDPDDQTPKRCLVAPFPPASQGTWEKLTNQFPGGGIEHVQLLMDGTVLMSEAGVGNLQKWRLLIPSLTGGYRQGIWTSAFTSHFGRQNHASGMLRDGRYLIGGGEYVTDKQGVPKDFSQCHTPESGTNNCSWFNKFEYYTPKTGTTGPINGTWTDAPDFDTDGPIDMLVEDGSAAPLPNGNLLIVPKQSANTSKEFNPSNNTFTTARSLPSSEPGARFVETSLCQLQNGKILLAGKEGYLYDQNASGGPTWSKLPTWFPNNPFAVDPNGTGEGGPAVTLYDGSVFIGGGTMFNGLYNPATGTTNNTFQSPLVPPVNERGTLFEDGPAVMRTGKVLLAMKSLGGKTHKFYEYGPGDVFKDVSYGGPYWEREGGTAVVLTPLPTGQILLVTQAFKDVYLYTPSGSSLTQYGQPTISTITGPVSGVYTLTGTNLNGLTNGANRDDEGQSSTSFPVISLQWSSSTAYAFIKSVSTSSIAPGTAVTVKFTIPPNVPHGTLTVRVSASGLPSSNSKSLTY